MVLATCVSILADPTICSDSNSSWKVPVPVKRLVAALPYRGATRACPAMQQLDAAAGHRQRLRGSFTISMAGVIDGTQLLEIGP
jgi:hypothetical protein